MGDSWLNEACGRLKDQGLPVGEVTIHRTIGRMLIEARTSPTFSPKFTQRLRESTPPHLPTASSDPKYTATLAHRFFGP
jgi:hypothetical protein